VCFVVLSLGAPAIAQTWTGAVSNDWTLGANWSGGIAPAGGNVTINTTFPNPTVLGTGGAATATSNALNVGVSGGTGNLTIQNGSVLTSTATTLVFIGQDAGSTGIMTVTGSGTRWTLLGAPGLNSIHVGGVGGTGTLQIVNGATATQTGDVAIGRLGGTGSLIIASGGAVTTGRDAFIGRLAGGNGTVTVDGAGSQWTVANGLFVGNGGTGTLNINNGAQVTAGTTVVGDPGGSGTLNMNGGTLATISLRGGAGASQANFDNAIVRARGNNASFITGFTGNELNLQAGGLAIDTGAFSVATDSTSAFSGVGGLIKTGSGTFTTLANNAYSGQTWIQSGILALTGAGAIANSSRVVADGLFDISGVAGAGTSIRSLAGGGNVALGARTLTLTAANDTFSGVIGGSGRLTVAGGTQVLTGANTYTGGTTITAGTLQLGAGGTSGSIVGDVTNNGALAFNRSNTYSFGGVISGTGVVNQIGVGTTVLTGVNSYSGGTNINAGVLSVSSNANLGAAGGAVTFNGGRLTNTASFTANRPTTINAATGTFETLDDLTWAGSITGAGTLVKEGDASLVLTGASNHAGGTIVSAGTVQIGNGGATGSITGPVVNNATLAFNRNNTYEFAGEISGSGALNQIGTGTTVLTANNSYTGATTISAGTLQLGNGGTSGSVLGNITNNSALAFNRSDVFLMPGIITGTGSVSQIGTGATVLDGANIYTGGTNITAGALRLGNGGTTGSIVGNVVNNGALEFFRSNRMDFDGVISGSGTIRQIGSGLTNLTGDSSGFTGTTSLSAGTLAVNGSLCGDMNVLAGGRLQGTGTVCTTSNLGTIAPGNSIGTLTVNGNYTGNNGLLEMETQLGGDASPTDRLVVTGNTAGATRVRVINVGGAGALTNEGIRIIDVGGLSNGNFILQGDYVFQGMAAVIAGAYSYVLQRNGISTPTDGDWYLRSRLPVTPAPPTPSPPGAPPQPSPEPLPPQPSGGPIFAPTVPVYESYARVMLSLNELPTMEQRIGHRFRAGPDAMASMGVADASAWAVTPLWARVEGGTRTSIPSPRQGRPSTSTTTSSKAARIS
jgi:T5SS/PEP-CTERM-associated repeat protein/autotransporter-associated beta strand protein